MKKFLNSNLHWLILMIIGISFLTSFISLPDSKPDIIALIFGGIGLLAFGFLAFETEKRKRNRKDRG